MVSVIKSHGDAPSVLIKAVKRVKFILPTAEDVIVKLYGAGLFSFLDQSSGFYQIPLDEETQAEHFNHSKCFPF